MRGSRKPMGVVVSWVRRQPPKVKAFLAVVAGMAALVFICFIVNDHDNLFVAAEAAHALGIAVLVYKLTKEKTCAASGTRQGLQVHEAPGLPSLVGRGDCTEVSELNIAFPDVNADDRVVDEGTLCWNLLSSRLFFDAKMSDEINKAIKAHIQVPLSLAIKISSVRGILRIHLKPPPSSDQLWYGFTSMPDLEWDLEPSIGDRKITNSHIASLIGNRFKTHGFPTGHAPPCNS